MKKGAEVTPVIEAKGLTRHFGDLVAVDRVSFQVPEGEVFGFLGPNGAGKTTTVRMLTGVLDPTGGTASIQGHDVRREPVLSREHIAVVPEEANAYLDLSVWRNVMLSAELYGIHRAERTRRGEELLEELGLADRNDQEARALSKGLRQRLMLASALITGPEILFLDEPTGGLDVQSRRLIRDIVAQMNDEGLTVFLTTHDMHEAEKMCDRVAIMDEGSIIATDTPDDLREAVQASQRLVVRFGNGGLSADRLEELSGVERVTRREESYVLYAHKPGRIAADVVRLADREGLSVEELETEKATLEDIFVYLTSGIRGEDSR